MIIDKSKLQPLLWAVVGAWNASDQDLHLHTDALDEFLSERTLEEVALGLLADIERLELIARISCNFDGYKAVLDERDQLKAENSRLRTDIESWRLTVEAERNINRVTGDELERLKGPGFDAELAALRKDALRYRWLRDGCGVVEYKAIAGSIGPGMLPSGDKLQAAIDAAMAKEASHG